jgi:hypothetical protein
LISAFRTTPPAKHLSLKKNNPTPIFISNRTTIHIPNVTGVADGAATSSPL